MNIEAFPLAWPDYLEPSFNRKASKFKCTLIEARDGITRELRLLGVKEFTLSTNAKVSKTGLLVDGRLIYPNPGVAVYFKYNGREKVIACDRWKNLHENLRAVEKTINAIRGMEMWGTSDIINQALPDLKQLPVSAGASNGAWWDVLQVPMDASAEVCKASWRLLTKKYHPDSVTGDRVKFEAVQRAYMQATNQVP